MPRTDIPINDLLTLLVILVAGVFALWVLREVVAWYFKANEILVELRRIAAALERDTIPPA